MDFNFGSKAHPSNNIAHSIPIENLDHEPVSGPAPIGNEAVTFVNVSEIANISQFNGNYFAWADYNNDKYQDLLVNGKRLLRNNGPPDWDFTDVTSLVNISYSGSINVGVWGDWDNDRYMDFYAAGGGWTTDNPTTYDVLWHNSGPPNYTFEDMTQQAGNVRDSYPSVAAGWGDYDNDGYIDLYVANYENTNLVGYPDTFWHNNGDGTFSDVTAISGVGSGENRPGRSVAWCDYNNDGWLDIHVGNYRLKPNTLWLNNHDGTFTDVGTESGSAGIYDPDIYYDAQAQSTYGGDGKYGPTWGHTIGSAWGDLNNDGNMDIWDSNLVHKYVGPSSFPTMPYDIRGYVCDDSKIYENNGGPWFNFTDIRESAGIPLRPIGGSGTYNGDELWSGVAMGDYDNDGDLDVFVPQIYDLNYAYSLLYRNNNDGTFTDMGQTLGIRVTNTYGAAWCDYNNDGFLDLVTGGKSPFSVPSNEIHLFKNNGNSNNWLKIKLDSIENNRAGIGARIILKTSSGTQYRQMEGGMGSHSQQNSLVVHFGTGADTTITELTVKWPGGRANMFHNFPANQEIDVLEEFEGPDITAISVSETEINEDDSITVDGSATDPDGIVTLYEWDFYGDNIVDWSSSNNARTTHSYSKSGRYYAKLRVRDDSGRHYTEKSTDFIMVNNVPPVANAGSDHSVFEDENILFNSSGSSDTASDLQNLEYNWSFGDGTYSGWIHNTETIHTYSGNGNYDVLLSVRDDDNETDTDTIQITVKNKLPSCVILTDKQAITEDSPISFTAIGNDTSSDYPTLLYRWDFGDNNGTYWTTETEFVHTYTQKGFYNVRCFVRDDDWPRDENYTEKMITVYNVHPNCTFEFDSIVNEDETAYFSALGNDTVSDRAGILYFWDFADGTTSDWLEQGYQNISHVYTGKGIYLAKLILKDDDGAQCVKMMNLTVNNVLPSCSIENMDSDKLEILEDDIVSFSGAGTDTKSDLPTLRYSWDFGIPYLPGTPWNTSTEMEYRYRDAGEYIALLTVRDDDGDTANASVSITVTNVLPTPRFIISESTVFEDHLLRLDASGSEDTASDIETLNFTWDFGDNTPKDYGIDQKHKYTESKEYRVKLTVRDDNGFSETASQNVQVKNVKPIAKLTVSSMQAAVGVEIKFSGLGSLDTKSDIENLSYSWDFGDNKNGFGQIATHSYKTEGRYNVILTVIDDDGSEDLAEIEIKIYGDVEVSQEKREEGNIWLLLLAGLLNIILIIILILLVFYFKAGYIPFISKPKKAEKSEDSELSIQNQSDGQEPKRVLMQSQMPVISGPEQNLSQPTRPFIKTSELHTPDQNQDHLSVPIDSQENNKDTPGELKNTT
jgi:PKD repeat protein